MKSLKDLEPLDFEVLPGGKYKLLQPIVYTSHRYNKTITVPAGFVSDGASGPAEDIVSKSWWVHDMLCETKRWDDGSYCSATESSFVIHDILMKENRWFRARTWFCATFLWEYFKEIFGDKGKPQPPKKLDVGKLPFQLA